MYKLRGNAYLSVTGYEGTDVEKELGDCLMEITKDHARPVDNSSTTQTYILEMRTTGPWIRDSFGEMYVDMSQTDPDKILKDAYEATNTFIEPKISFSEFCKSNRVRRNGIR